MSGGNWIPEVGDNVVITADCKKINIKIGDIVQVIEYDDGGILFEVNNNIRCWTDAFAKPVDEWHIDKFVNYPVKITEETKVLDKKCICSMNTLLAEGCKCGGN